MVRLVWRGQPRPTFKGRLATALALGLGVSAVNAHETHDAPERTVGQAIDDASITASVKAQLLADTAASTAARAAAIKIAAGTRGVKTVVADQLRVQ